MNKYEHLSGQFDEIEKALKELQSYDTLARAKQFLGNIYYRKCVALPRYISRYNEQSKEHHTKKYIKQKLRCPNCVIRFESYFKKYVEYTRNNNK